MNKSLHLIEQWQDILSNRDESLDEENALQTANDLYWAAQVIKTELTPAGEEWYNSMDTLVPLGPDPRRCYTATQLLDDLHLHNLPSATYIKKYPAVLGNTAWWMEQAAQALEAPQEEAR